MSNPEETSGSSGDKKTAKEGGELFFSEGRSCSLSWGWDSVRSCSWSEDCWTPLLACLAQAALMTVS